MKRFVAWTAIAVISISAAASQQIPSPEQVLGFRVGADRKLADWQQIVDYFRKLGQASPRVLIQEPGRTTQDNPFLLAIISSPDVLANLETYRRIQQQLADPRRLEGSVEELVEQGRTVVLITCAIHSTEVASAQMSMEFAHDLATGKDAETREILQNVIFLFVPALNPDGVNIVNHWYWETLGTPAEGTSPPRLYHPYTGHDNNRDWFMFTQKETRLTIQEIHNVWHPQIVFDVHQMGAYGARMFVPPFIDPIDPNVDPILQAGVAELGMSLFSALITAGKAGVVTNAIYDAFSPARAYQHYHAGVRILSEAASARLATPVQVTPEQLASGRNYDVRRSSWNYPVPWTGGEWRLRDIVDYEKIALHAALLHAARQRKTWLRNFYQVGRNALERTRPFAFVLPTEQGDPQGLQDLLEVLRFGMVELHQAREPFEVSSAQLVSPPFGQPVRQRFPQGSYVIRMQQPYSAFAKTLLEIQRYPEWRVHPRGPLRRPYDVTAHSLGIQLGVEVHQVDDAFDVLSQEVLVPKVLGQSQGKGRYWLFPHRNNAFARLANRLLARGQAVYWAPNGFRAGGEGYPVGTMMGRVGEDEGDVEQWLGDLPVEVHRLTRRPELAWQRIRLPRIALYKNHAPAMDEGWTRWILEQYEFPYQSLLGRNVREDDLSEFDVIVFPHQNVQQIVAGLGEPLPKEYRGGLGQEGLDRLKGFVESGGTVVLLGNASNLAVKYWGIGARDVTEGLSSRELYIPGSLLRVEVNNRHPLGYGMPEEAGVMFINNPVFEVSAGQSVVRYAQEKLLLSGWIDGSEHLAGRTALAVFTLGRGRVILMGFRTQFRAQTRSTYKFLFNSLYWSTTGR